MLDLEKLINKFFVEYIPNNPEIEIYNEFSLQHELGIFLRNELKMQNYKIQFERNINYFSNKTNKTNKMIKKEIDIVIFNDDKSEKYAIELKYPRNRAFSKRMYSFVEDIKFMEDVKELLGFTKTACVSLTDNALFYDLPKSNKLDGIKPDGIYRFFRGKEKVPLSGTIKNHSKQKISLRGHYNIEWKTFDKNDDSKQFYIVVIEY